MNLGQQLREHDPYFFKTIQLTDNKKGQGGAGWNRLAKHHSKCQSLGTLKEKLRSSEQRWMDGFCDRLRTQSENGRAKCRKSNYVPPCSTSFSVSQSEAVTYCLIYL